MLVGVIFLLILSVIYLKYKNYTLEKEIEAERQQEALIRYCEFDSVSDDFKSRAEEFIEVCEKDKTTI